MKRLMFVILCLVGVLFFKSHWIFACLLYLFGGFFWVSYEKQLPCTHQSLGFYTAHGKLVIYFIWPLRLYFLLLGDLKMMFSNERYIVAGKHESLKYFGDWTEAREYAIKKAHEEAETVTIVDQAKIVKQYGELGNKSWFVDPDGKVEKLSRNL